MKNVIKELLTSTSLEALTVSNLSRTDYFETTIIKNLFVRIPKKVL